MYRGPYSAPMQPVAMTAAADILHLTVATDNPVTLLGLHLYQTTDLGDAQEEVLSIGLYRGVTGGSGGTAITEVHYGDAGGSAATAAVLQVPTTSTAGTLIETIGWNIRVPLMWVPIPELRPSLDASQDPLVFRLLAAPTDSISIGGTLFWFEG